MVTCACGGPERQLLQGRARPEAAVGQVACCFLAACPQVWWEPWFSCFFLTGYPEVSWTKSYPVNFAWRLGSEPR